MVIAKREWFERKNKRNHHILDISWQGIVYFVVMWISPIILLEISLWFVLVDIRNMNLIIISLAWLIFSFTDTLDSNLLDPLIKPLTEEEKNLKIAKLNVGWSILLILITGVIISLIYNIYTWNFYLGLFTITAFVACIVIAITKYKFEKREMKNF